MVMINTTGTLGLAIASFTNDYTGSLTLTFLSIFILLVAIGLGFRMLPELTLAIIFPFVIALMVYDSSFRIIGGIIILILAALGAKNWFF